MSFTVLQVKQIPSWSGSLFSVIFFNHFEYGKSGKPNSYLIAIVQNTFVKKVEFLLRLELC